MHKNEKSAVVSLALIMAFRMLGLFMILPVFSAYAGELKGATPTLIGVALGVYGLTQACLQMPFGALSDRIGRKPIILTGLLLFAIGSAVAALSTSITGVIIGRAIQGAGAVGSTVLAMVADLTRDEHRSKAMAMIGLCIGISFTIAIIVGPILNSWWHLSGLFWTTMGLALIGMLLTIYVPTPPKLVVHPDLEARSGVFESVLSNTQLLRLDLGIACLHAILTATFVAIPILLTHILRLHEEGQIFMYLVVLVVSFILMVPLIIIAEKKRKMKSIFNGAIAAIAASQILLYFFHHSVYSIGALLLLYFTAFILLEASLPSLVSKISPIRNKGTAMGVYSTSQFFGIFVGGIVGGALFGHYGLKGVFVFSIIVAAIWLITAVTMKQPPYLSTIIISPPSTADCGSDLYHKLRKIAGVAEVAFLPDEQLVYFKIDKKIISEDELRNRIETGNLTESLK
ncbi:MAG: MFS transporter [Gammaproteobacteria bacterium]|nr:MFS transporter [Gammaproteobacteria bacterium]